MRDRFAGVRACCANVAKFVAESLRNIKTFIQLVSRKSKGSLTIKTFSLNIAGFRSNITKANDDENNAGFASETFRLLGPC